MSWMPKTFYDPRIDITEEAFWCTIFAYKMNTHTLDLKKKIVLFKFCTEMLNFSSIFSPSVDYFS